MSLYNAEEKSTLYAKEEEKKKSPLPKQAKPAAEEAKPAAVGKLL